MSAESDQPSISQVSGLEVLTSAGSRATPLALLTGTNACGYSARVIVDTRWHRPPATSPVLAEARVSLTSRACVCAQVQPCQWRLLALFAARAAASSAASAAATARQQERGHRDAAQAAHGNHSLMTTSFFEDLVRPAEVWEEMAQVSADGMGEHAVDSALAESFHDASSQMLSSLSAARWRGRPGTFLLPGSIPSFARLVGARLVGA